MSDESNIIKPTNEGYRTAFKATALFGGVQAVTIIIQVARSKIIAILLGSVGFGIVSLFNAAIGLISSITNLGLQQSAVRDIAAAQSKDDVTLVSKIVKAINRWVIATGLAGALITILLSPWLSRWLFESDQYTVSFILLSSVVLMTGIYNGHYATLQGTRKLKLMARANIFGALAGFVCSVPMYYFFRESGIVWAMILTAAATLFVSIAYVRKADLVKVDQTFRESFHLGLDCVKLGIALAITSVVVLAVEFIVKAFIVHSGGLSDVGLYQAGWALNASYLGVVFTAMAKDYFPRLSQHCDDNNRLCKMVNEQSEIAILLLAPLIVGMIVFMPFVIRVLYSSEFLPIESMTRWLLIGSLVKAGSWGISYVFIAKGARRLFLFNELGIKFVTLPSYLLGYHWFGLSGIGYAYTLIYVIYFIWVAVVAYKNYNIAYNNRFWRLFIILTAITLSLPVSDFLFGGGYFPGILIFITASAISLYGLDKRLNIRQFLKK